VRVAAGAAVLSGIPSGLVAVARGTAPAYARQAVTAIAAIVGLDAQPRPVQWVAAGTVHAAISAGWTVVLAATLPGRRPVIEGLLAGSAIAALDLGVVGRRVPAVAALEPGPQVLDHLAFGVLASIGLSRAYRFSRPA